MIDTITPVEVAAPLVATAALLATLWAARQPRTRRLLGPAADGWEYARRLVWPLLDRLAGQHLPGDHYATYEIGEAELVGLLDVSASSAWTAAR